VSLVSKLEKILKHSVVKNMSSLALIQVGNYIIPLLIIPYISRIVGLENFGKLEYARTLVAYFTVFIDYGFNITATRAISLNRDNREKINSIVSRTFTAKLILLFISTFVFWLMLRMENGFEDISFLLWATFIFNFGQFLFPIWYYQGIEKIASISFINFFIKLGILLGVILLLKTKDQYWIYNLLISLAHVLFGLISVYILFKKYRVHLVKFKLKELLDVFKSGFSIFFSTILVAIFVTYSFILLKEYGTEAEVGEYSTANKLVMTIRVLIMLPFSQAFFPYIAKIASEDIQKFKQQLRRVTIFLFSITLGVTLFTLAFSNWIVSIIFGEEFLSSVDVLQILVFLPIFSTLTNIFAYQGLLSLKQDKTFLVIHIVFTILIIITSYLLVPHYGVVGVAYIRVVSEALLMFSALFFLIRYLSKTNES